MAIKKELELTVFGGKAKLNEAICVYQNDGELELKLKLNLTQNPFKPTTKSLLFDDNNMFVSATVLSPNGDVTNRDKVAIVDSIITFVIDKHFTDEFDKIGVHQIQFHLHDVNDNKITISPIQFEVKELLGSN